MRTISIGVGAVALACLVTTACLRPSESRAERDREVGHATAAGLRVDVAGGLAAVRDLTPGRLWLWGSAPTLQVALERDASAPLEWELLIDNCMPDARLVAPPEIPAEPIERGVVTQCGWTVGLPADETVQFTIRSLQADSLGPFRFAVLSDVQNAIDEIDEVFARVSQDPDVSFAISTGDLTESGRAEQLVRFQSQLRALPVPFFSTLGNHELGASPLRFHDYFGRGNFHFAYRGVHFTMLDSASATVDPIVYDWLESWLEEGRGAVHVMAMHIPPLDPVGVRNGAFGSRNEAAMLLAQLARGQVDLMFYGHIHSYYHFNNAGIDAHVSGGGGALPERFDGIGRHYLSVDVDPSAGTSTVDVVRVD